MERREMSREPFERHEHVELDEAGEEELRELQDLAAEKQNEINKVNGVIWLLAGILEALIGLRVILKVLAANPANSFASFIYNVSHLFLAPFFGLVGEPRSDGNVLEISSLIAMVVYFLIAVAIVRLVEISMMPTRVRHLRTVQRHH